MEHSQLPLLGYWFHFRLDDGGSGKQVPGMLQSVHPMEPFFFVVVLFLLVSRELSCYGATGFTASIILSNTRISFSLKCLWSGSTNTLSIRNHMRCPLISCFATGMSYCKLCRETSHRVAFYQFSPAHNKSICTHVGWAIRVQTIPDLSCITRLRQRPSNILWRYTSISPISLHQRTLYHAI